MAFIVFIICPFYYHEKLPNCVQNLTKVVTLFAKYYINLHEIAKDILFYAKVAKFNEIWSHWGKIVWASSQPAALTTMWDKRGICFIAFDEFVAFFSHNESTTPEKLKLTQSGKCQFSLKYITWARLDFLQQEPSFTELLILLTECLHTLDLLCRAKIICRCNILRIWKCKFGLRDVNKFLNFKSYNSYKDTWCDTIRALNSYHFCKFN